MSKPLPFTTHIPAKPGRATPETAMPAPVVPDTASPAAAATETKVVEIGGPKGPDPTRFGDWEIGGRCIDF